jgi:hypothetical protein
MRKTTRLLAWLMILTGAGIALFWVAFFTFDLVPKNAPPCYLAFEHAFPPPDGLLALGLIAAGVLTLTGRPAGRSLSLVCAGGLLFLGVIDISFNFQNGIYGLGFGEMLSMAAINLWCVVFGAILAMRPSHQG